MKFEPLDLKWQHGNGRILGHCKRRLWDNCGAGLHGYRCSGYLPIGRVPSHPESLDGRLEVFEREVAKIVEGRL